METVIVPHADSIPAGKFLLLIVLVAISGNRPAAIHHMRVDICFAKIHGSDQAVKLINMGYHNTNSLASDQLNEPALYDRAMIDGLTPDYRGLAILGGIKAGEPNLAIFDSDAVCVGNSGATDDLV